MPIRPIRNEKGWTKVYEECKALWIHDGNPKRPHALLSRGSHSGGYFNSSLVMEDPFLLSEAAHDLIVALIGRGVKPQEIDRVVGPAMGAITLAHDIARIITRDYGRLRQGPCLTAYAEKGGSEMVFNRATILPGERVLVVEDVLTTGRSSALTMDAVTRAGARVLPVRAVLVNRSDLAELGGSSVVALINRYMPIWADECPLCNRGSEALRPKGKENWAKLNDTY